VHRTTGEQPWARFRAQEQHQLLPLAERPYRSLILLPSEPAPPVVQRAGRVEVEKRPLQTYARLAGGAA
jgi:hypothetical protein